MSSLPTRIITEARGWIGTPYLHQASVKGIGCDCLGLLRGVWRGVYGHEPETPPPYAAGWTAGEGQEPLLEAATRHLILREGSPEPGDVLLFRWREHLPAKHCAILVTSDTMIHAHDGACVAEVPFRPWWQRHVAGVFRFPEL